MCFKMAAATILIFTERWNLVHSKHHIANVYLPAKFDAITAFIGDRNMPENKIQDGGRRHLEFLANAILGP